MKDGTVKESFGKRERWEKGTMAKERGEKRGLW